ncbi:MULTISPECIES: IS66 family transposase [Dethiosulfovibrio]|nr:MULTISPECIES: transposase [Dethiosulfovibrio]
MRCRIRNRDQTGDHGGKTSGDKTNLSLVQRDDKGSSACNRDYAYISVEKKRGYDGMVASGILTWFRGIAVHDFWRSYERFDVNHVYCNAHLIRELRPIHENTGQEWALKLRKLLVWAQHKKKEFIAAGKDRFSPYCCRYRIDKPFDELLASGIAQNPLPTGNGARGRPKKSMVDPTVKTIF